MHGPLKDAWNTLSPDPGGADGPLPPQLVLLTVVTGILDAFSYLELGHVFVANMTGNVVFIAFSLAGAEGFSITASITAIAGFSVGALLGGRIGVNFSRHRGKLLAAAVLIEAIVVLAAFICSLAGAHISVGWERYALIVLLSVAMGTQNACARKLAVADLTTTVLTLTLTGISADGRIAGGLSSKIGRRAISIGAMFAGALAGALLALKTNPSTNLLLAFAILLIISAEGSRLRKSTEPWTRSLPGAAKSKARHLRGAKPGEPSPLT